MRCKLPEEEFNVWAVVNIYIPSEWRPRKKEGEGGRRVHERKGIDIWERLLETPTSYRAVNNSVDCKSFQVSEMRRLGGEGKNRKGVIGWLPHTYISIGQVAMWTVAVETCLRFWCVLVRFGAFGYILGIWETLEGKMLRFGGILRDNH